MSAQILQELAAQTAEIGEFFGLTFEQGEDYWAIADGRISAFASEQMWAVVFEIVGYDPGADEYASHVYLLGNCVQARDSIYLPNVNRILLTTPNAWNKEIEAGQVRGIARERFSVLYRGRRHDFSPTLQGLQGAGIELSRAEIASGELTPPQMLRYVCEKWEHPFFLGEDALRALLDAHAIPFEPKHDATRSWYENALGQFNEPPILSLILELVLQTRDWIHPKVGDAHFDEGEWEVSPQQAFATLAQTLATRDAKVWHAQDATKFNSHWRNWAEIEADKDREHAAQLATAKAAFRAFVEAIAKSERAQFLEELRPSIEGAPSLFNWVEQVSIRRDGKTVQIFRELLDELDSLRAGQ